jgi:hypothetical protein
MRKTSLDEFVAGGDARDADRDDPAGPQPNGGGTPVDADRDEVDATDAETRPGAATTGGSETESDPPDGDAPPAPTAATFAWVPDGVACARCGEAAARRWRDDGDLVCSSCKAW